MKKGDFINFGAYAALEADMLKRELEKSGIPVKVLYPGTNVGREARGGAPTMLLPENNAALTLLIPMGYQVSAIEIRDNLSIKPQ